MNSFLLLPLIIILFVTIPPTRQSLYSIDNVPFAYMSSINLMLNNPYTFDYSSKNFKQPPLVIYGILRYNFNWKPAAAMEFYISSSSISKTSCTISSYQSVVLFDLHASLLAIDQSQYPYIAVFPLNISTPFSTGVTSSITRSFSPDIQSQTGTVKVIAFITGWKQGVYTVGTTTKFTLSISVSIINSTSYQITFQTNSQSISVDKIYYTVVEIITDPDTSIYRALANQDTTYSLPSSNTCLADTSCSPTSSGCLVNSTCKPRDFLVSIKVPTFPSVTSPIANYSQLFITVTKYDYTTTIGYSDPIIDIKGIAFQDQNTLTFNYQLESNAVSSGIESSEIFFYKLQCTDPNEKVYKGACILDCKNVSTTEPSFCIDCLQSNQYFLLDQKICTTTTPSSTDYFCFPERFYQKCVLSSQIPNCIQLQIDNNLNLYCIKCAATYYLYQGKCFLTKPNSSVCDSNNNCTQCTNSLCIECQIDSSSNQFCTKCQTNSFFYQGSCFTSKPSSTTCDSNNNCTKCSSSLCLECESTNNSNSDSSKCISCVQGYSLKQGFCVAPYAVTEQILRISNSTQIISWFSLSFGQSQTILTLQKLNLLFMLNIVYTEELSTFIEILRGTNPLNYFKDINLFSKYLCVESSYNVQEQILTNKIGQTSILINSGGEFAVFVFDILFFLILVLIDRKLKNIQQNKKSEKVFSFLQKTICFLFYKLNELATQITGYVLFLQIIGLAHSSQANYKGIKITFIFIVFIYQAILFVYYYRLLNCQNDTEEPKTAEVINQVNTHTPSFRVRLQKLILCENNYANFYSRNFIIGYLLVETFLLPFCMIIFYTNYKIQISIAIALQLSLLIVSLILRPSLTKINNIKLVIDQICWILLFVLALVYGIDSDQLLTSGQLIDDDIRIINLSTCIEVVILIALYSEPFFLFIKLLLLLPKLKEIIDKKLLKSQAIKEENELIDFLKPYSSFKINKNQNEKSENINKEYVNFGFSQRLCRVSTNLSFYNQANLSFYNQFKNKEIDQL